MSTETTVGWSICYLSDTDVPVHKDRLSTETTRLGPLSGLYRQVLLYVCTYVGAGSQAISTRQ
jgi:hypothetical protein